MTWALLLAKRESTGDMHLDDLVFKGPTALKGVWSGRDYPVFALDRRFDDKVNRSMKTLTKSKVDETQAERLCRECVTSDGWMSAIYLPRSGVDALKSEPADSLKAVREEASAVTGGETVPPGDPDKGNEPPEDEMPLGNNGADEAE
ncbi:hypothetical protein [Nocardioides sp. GCM10030258]|uniref:hypothetical protein n=1 Tax=unclassified Nocardioides TaxID=2615069 RepID=UPI00361130C8